MRLFTPANIITLGNLLCGCLGIYFSFNGEFTTAAYLGLFALVLDFFDGFVARITKMSSEIGKQLDSLADLVSFGVLPAFILFNIINQGSPEISTWAILALPLFTALRLAKFNIDTRQTEKFIGLPSPASAMFIFAIPFIFNRYPEIEQLLRKPYSYLLIILGLSLLMISEIPLFSLKFKNFSIKDYPSQFVFLFLSLILLVVFKLAVLPIIIISYILLSILQNNNIIK